jgi:lysozyme
MDAGIIDISPVRTGASLARRGVLTRYGGDNSAGGQQSGFNAIQWASSLLTHTKQQTHVLDEISSTLHGIRTDNIRFEKTRREDAIQTREALERASEESYSSYDYRPKRKDQDEDAKTGGNTLLAGIKSIFENWKEMSAIFRIIRSGISVVEGIAAFLGVGSFATIGALIIGLAWGKILGGILDAWGKAHKLYKGYQEEGKRGIAVDEAKALGISEYDAKGGAKETGALAREVANTLQGQGAISAEDRKAAGVAAYKEGEGFTDEDAMKYLQYRQGQRDKKAYQEKGVKKGSEFVAAALYGPTRETELKQKQAAPQPSATPAAAVPAYGVADTSVIQGEGMPVEVAAAAEPVPLIPPQPKDIVLPVAPPPPAPARVAPELTAPSAASTTPTRIPQTQTEMRTSEGMVAQLAQLEGFKPIAYQDAGDVWTIGHGLTEWDGKQVSPSWPGRPVTEEESRVQKGKMLAKFEKPINKSLRVPVTQQQFDALVSVAYNKGDANDLIGKINKGKQLSYEDFAATATIGGVRGKDYYNKKGEYKPQYGLELRRAREYSMFSGNTNLIPAIESRGSGVERYTRFTQALASTRQAGPLDAATASLARTQTAAPMIMAMNVQAGGKQAPPVSTQVVVPAPIRARTQDDVVRAIQTTNAV